MARGKTHGTAAAALLAVVAVLLSACSSDDRAGGWDSEPPASGPSPTWADGTERAHVEVRRVLGSARGEPAADVTAPSHRPVTGDAADLDRLRCDDPEAPEFRPLDPSQAVLACAADGGERFALGAAAVADGGVASATAGTAPGVDGWFVDIEFVAEAAESYDHLMTMLLGERRRSDRRLAVVVDGVVVSAPATVYQPGAGYVGGATQVSGLTRREARDLADRITPSR